jgi:CheY-like chemotaxis protein
MGGEISVESRVGVGSTFRVILPLKEAPPDQVSHGRDSIDPALATGRRVLIVDANEVTRRMLSLCCDSWRVSSATAGSAAEALELLRRGERFDIALLDCTSQEINGIELAKEIASLGLAHRPGILLMTHAGLAQAAVPADRPYISGVLTKPVHQSHLFDAIVGVLNASAGKLPYKYNPVAREWLLAPPMRILLAEDNVVNQRMAQLMLERLSQTADVVSNGLEAVNAATHLPYDLVLMDVLMPEMDGLDATRLIRERLPRARQPRIVAMTANALSGDRERCLAAGMDDYISKPIQLPELAKVIERNRPGAADALPADGAASVGSAGRGAADAAQIAGSAGASDDEMQETSANPGAEDALGYDREVIDQLLSVAGPAGASVVLGAMIDSAPGMLEGLQRAVATGDRKEIRRYAHSLKTNARTVGARSIARQFQELEQLGGNAPLEGTQAGTASASAAYLQLIEAMRRLREQLEA